MIALIGYLLSAPQNMLFQGFKLLRNSPVKSLYFCVASRLGFDTMSVNGSATWSPTLCPETCPGSNGTYCFNKSCLYSVSISDG